MWFAPKLSLRSAAAFIAVNCSSLSAFGQGIEVHPLDRNPAQYPDGRPIAQSVPASAEGMCWGDPSLDGRVITGEFGEVNGHKSSPHAGVDLRAAAGSPIYAVADGCIAFGNPTPRQLIGVKQRINDKYPNSTVWYLHMSRVVPKYVNDGRTKACIPIRRGDLLGFSGNFYGSGGKEVASGSAHLHLSYFVSGLQLNPTPYVGAPKEIPAEFNTVKSVNEIATEVAAAGGVRDNDASGTRGSKLGFAVPRMCSIYVVKGTSSKTLPFDASFGIGSYVANATAPSRSELNDGQQRVRQSMGIGPDGRAPGVSASSVGSTASGAIADPAHWSGGLPEEPDWNSYSEMSLEQIVQAEVARRNADARWAEKLMEQSERGLAQERLWIKALLLKLRYESALSKQRQEVMLASLLTSRARRAADALRSQVPVSNQVGVR